MKKRGIQVLAAIMSALLIVQSPGVSGFLDGNPRTAYADIYRQATVNATALNVRSGPGTGNSIVKKLSYGTAVTVIGETKDSAGTVWYQIRFTSGSETKEGYTSSAYIKFPTTYSQDADFERYLTQQGFPESYKDSFRTLHAEHPTWVFQAQKTGLDWKNVIENEAAVGANLVANSSISSWKSTEYGAYDWNTGKWTGFDGASWVAASEEIVCYYMDPRNFLNDTYIFQFLNHNYDSAYQTKEGLQSLVSGTFLEKAAVSGGTAGGTTNQSAEPGGGTSENGYSRGPGYSGGPGYSNGSGSQSQSGQSQGPGSGQITVPAETQAPSTSAAETQAPDSGVQVVSPAAGNQGNVSLEGPSVSVSARVSDVLALPNVEYGPGMDASAITGDTTGASSTSPVSDGMSYVDIIMNAASQSGVNPYVLGAMIIQEQGAGTSGSISGKTSGYEGYYNFFNIGAYQAGSMSAVTRGLWYASQSGNYGRPWNSIEKSIVGGALYYGENYVKQGQDTFYLKKFNVQGSNLYKHQYMTNVEGAAGEGAKLARAYTDEMKKQTLVFKIPIYNNMPETACAKPTGSGSPNNKLSALEVTGYALTPTFSMNTESYDIIVNPSVERIAVNATAIDSKATVSGIGTIELQSGNNTISVDIKAENGSVRTYKLNVVRQSDAPVVNVTAGTGTGNAGQVTGPNANVSAGPGAVGNVTAGSVSTGGGPGAAETSAAETTAAVSPQAPAGSPEVEVGAGPGGAPAGSTGGGNAVQPETQAPAATEAPGQSQNQAPAATEAPAQAPAQPQETEASLKKGDCNGDGSVTILDLMLIKQYILGKDVLSGAQKTAADMDGDGSVTSADASALQKIILGQ